MTGLANWKGSHGAGPGYGNCRLVQRKTDLHRRAESVHAEQQRPGSGGGNLGTVLGERVFAEQRIRGREIVYAGELRGAPIDLGGPTDVRYVMRFGTGLHNLSSAANVHASIGGVAVQVACIVPQGSPALDQVNLVAPCRLAGAGEVPIVIPVDGQTANAVTMSLR